MSQNDNLYSAFKRPRESFIPQPSSALRRSTLAPPPNTASMPPPRLSMAPPRHSVAPTNRISSFGTPSDPPPSALKSARKSFAPGAFSSQPSSHPSLAQQQQQQQQPPSSARRSSSYTRPPGSQISAGNGFFSSNIINTAGITKDPRPLRDRSFLARIAGEILEYLATNNFEAETKYQVSPHFLKSPTQKDFNMVFEYLYHQLDPNYHFAKPMDQEVLPILKTLRYPYSNAITKSALAAVGGANTWPTFLGMLHWLLELVRMMEGLDSGDFEAAVEEEGGLDVGSDRIVFEFAARSYQAWLQGVDDHNEYIQEMVSQFDERVVRYTQDVEELGHQNMELREQLEKINLVNSEGKTPLQVLEMEKVILEKDKEKFLVYIGDLEGLIQKQRATNERLREKVRELDEELVKLEEEKMGLQRAVDRQGLSPQDIDRMAGEREKLDKGLAVVSAKVEELRGRAKEKEGEAMSKLEELEGAVARYNTLAYQIGVVPPQAANAKGKAFELILFPNKASGGGGEKMQIEDVEGIGGAEDARLLVDSGTGWQPQQLSNRDLRHEVKQNLNRLRAEIGERIHMLQDEGLRGNELIDKVNEALGDLKEEVETLQVKVQGAQVEFEKIKETMTSETNLANTEIEKLERELQSLRLGMNSGVLSLDQRLQSVTIEWDQLQHAADALRQELHGEVERVLNDIIKFKVHIQEGLGEFEKRLEEEARGATGGLDLSMSVDDDEDGEDGVME
ncbi:HEC/Ndc80p family-domain-containing protein [Tirmania nivea]|nr:HEC/Ndc80p family-domain-containing protein [Tirmania nivea]